MEKPTFARYIGIHYFGAETRESRLRPLRVYARRRGFTGRGPSVPRQTKLDPPDPRRMARPRRWAATCPPRSALGYADSFAAMLAVKTLQEKLGALPASRRQKIARRTALLIAEEMTMRELRKARQLTQVDLAKSLGVKQEPVSRIEQRSHMHLSTLRRHVEAMGGELILTAKFPDVTPVRLTGCADLRST